MAGKLDIYNNSFGGGGGGEVELFGRKLPPLDETLIYIITLTND
jgi:hypothetical protein